MSALKIDCPNETLIAKLDTIADNTQKPVYEVGIIASATEDKTFCSNSALGDDNFCKDLIDRTELDKFLTTDCVGKQSCQLTNLPQYVGTAGESQANCVGEDA